MTSASLLPRPPISAASSPAPSQSMSLTDERHHHLSERAIKEGVQGTAGAPFFCSIGRLGCGVE